MADDNGAEAPARYELNELFPEESAGAIQALKIVGTVVIVALLALALAYVAGQELTVE